MIQHEIIETFSMLWWQSNLTTIVIITALLYFSKFLNENQLNNFSRIIGVILISRAILFHPYSAALGNWHIQDSLPLHLCGFSSILAGVIMFYRRQWMYELLFYWGIPGAFHSLLTPEFTSGMQGLMFYDYFLSHGGIMFAALFCTLRLNYQPRRGSWWKIFIWTQLLMLIVGGINWLLGSNYMYLCKPPLVDNPFVFGKFPYHLIGFEIAGLIHFFAVYFPFMLKYQKNIETIGAENN